MARQPATARSAAPGRPTGWRALWRGFRTLIVLGLQASRGMLVYVYGVEIASNIFGLFSTYTVKLLVDAAVARLASLGANVLAG